MKSKPKGNCLPLPIQLQKFEENLTEMDLACLANDCHALMMTVMQVIVTSLS